MIPNISNYLAVFFKLYYHWRKIETKRLLYMNVLTPQAQKKRARHLIGLALLAELKTNQRNLLALILDKATLWEEDRKDLNLRKVNVNNLISSRKQKRLYRLKDAVFSLRQKRQLRQGLVYKDETYKPSSSKR